MECAYTLPCPYLCIHARIARRHLHTRLGTLYALSHTHTHTRTQTHHKRRFAGERGHRRRRKDWARRRILGRPASDRLGDEGRQADHNGSKNERTAQHCLDFGLFHVCSLLQAPIELHFTTNRIFGLKSKDTQFFERYPKNWVSFDFNVFYSSLRFTPGELNSCEL